MENYGQQLPENQDCQRVASEASGYLPGPALFPISALEWQAWYYANSKDKAMLTSCLKGNTGQQACKFASLLPLGQCTL